MGGSSLAPEVICAAAGVELDVLDSSDPDFVRTALEDRLAETVVVVSSKSGGTVETDSQRRAFEKAFTRRRHRPRRADRRRHRPGLPARGVGPRRGLPRLPRRPDGRRPVLRAHRVRAGPQRAGRRRHRRAARRGRGDPPGARGRLGRQPRACGSVPCSGSPTWPASTSWCIAEAGAPYPGFGDWAEQLVAESTGKDGKGILPVVVEGLDAPNFQPSTPDEVLCTVGPDFVFDSRPPGLRLRRVRRRHARRADAAVGVRHRRRRPADRDQPVRPARRRERQGGRPVDARRRRQPADAGVRRRRRSRSTPPRAGCPTAPPRSRDAVAALLDQLDAEHGYVAVQAYLDRHRDAGLAAARGALARRTGRPVTFGWGPRFLHSTGQYHKGGPDTGVYLQVTGQPEADLAVPDRPFTFHEFLTAQAVGDGSGAGRQGPAGAAPARERPGRPRRPAGSAELTPYVNPLRDPQDRRLPRIAGPCGMVLFGVTGDLSRKKVMPAIYDLANRGLLPPGFSLVGFARRDWANQDFAQIVHDSVKELRPHRVPRGGVEAARRGLPVRPGQLRRRRRVRQPAAHHRGARRGPRHRRQPRVLPRDPAGVLR